MKLPLGYKSADQLPPLNGLTGAQVVTITTKCSDDVVQKFYAASHSATPLVLVVDAGDSARRTSAVEAGVAAVVPRPVKTSLLEKAVVSAVLGRGRYQQMGNELIDAQAYVRSLIPPPTESPLRIDWRYIPATQLAGDSLGFHWIGDSHCAFYVVDATGHGIRASLQSVSILDALKSQSLPATDFCRPEQVLARLNRTFRMETHDDRCFTVWYGVYERASSTLSWSGGGHPPALLVSRNGNRHEAVQLPSRGPLVGMLPDARFPAATRKVSPGDRLYVYSDGVYEIETPDGEQWSFEDFVAYMTMADEAKRLARSAFR